MTASAAKIARMTSPAITFGELGSRVRNQEAPARTGAGSGVAVVPASLVTSVVMRSGLLSSAGVDQDVDPVRDEVREQHHQGDDHEDALDQRVVIAEHRLEQEVADAGVAEDDLDEQLAGDHQADGSAKLAMLGRSALRAAYQTTL